MELTTVLEEVTTLPALADPNGITSAATWLNTTFGNLDHMILQFYHNLHETCGRPLDLFVNVFTRLGDGGIFLICVGLILIMFRKSRKVGMGMVGGILIGAIFTNLTIKNVVARPRPYAYTLEYQNWWIAAGQVLESEFSFPSGHTTAAMASMTPVFFFCNKKKSWTAFLFVIALGASRNYLMVHFPSDILGGIIVGGIAGLIAYILLEAFYEKLTQHGRLGNFIGTSDVRNIFKKKA